MPREEDVSMEIYATSFRVSILNGEVTWGKHETCTACGGRRGKVLKIHVSPGKQSGVEGKLGKMHYFYSTLLFVIIEAFRSFPCIQILELSLNSIMDVSIEQGDFLKLKNLDLSYNNLSDTALLTLGTLPSLKELKLTGNNLVALPVEMSVPYLVEGSEQ